MAVQATIWTLSGLYMTAIHINIIHGDHFIRVDEPVPIAATELTSPAGIAAATGADVVKLSRHLGPPVYIARSEARDLLFDARTGHQLPAPSREQIRQLAEHWFTGPEPLARLELITELPTEVRGREPPLWRAEFDGWNKPTLYLSPETGELLTRRHELWRIFDFLWMLHIMDYETRDNVNNWLLRAFTLLALTTAISGAWLLWFAFPRRRRRTARR